MSPRTLIPFSFIGTMGQIIVCSLLLQTQAKYPPYSSVNTTLIAGCALIILFAVLQIGFLASGINISNNRIIFESTASFQCRLHVQYGKCYLTCLVCIQFVAELVYSVHLGVLVGLPDVQRLRRTHMDEVLNREVPQIHCLMTTVCKTCNKHHQGSGFSNTTTVTNREKYFDKSYSLIAGNLFEIAFIVCVSSKSKPLYSTIFSTYRQAAMKFSTPKTSSRVIFRSSSFEWSAKHSNAISCWVFEYYKSEGQML